MKQRLKAAVFCVHSLYAICCSAGPQEQVAVAEAIVWANQHFRPELPSDPYQENRSAASGSDQHAGPTPLSREEFINRQSEQITQLLGKTCELEMELLETREKLTAANDCIAGMNSASGSADRSGPHPSASLVPPSGAGGLYQSEQLSSEMSDQVKTTFLIPPFTRSSTSMRLELPSEARPMATFVPRSQLVIEVQDNCPPCNRLKRDIKSLLLPKGWDIGEREDAQIRFVNGSADITFPRITLYQNGEMVDRWNGYQDPSFLSHRLRTAWDEATEPVQTRLQTGLAGTIHAAAQIRQAIEYVRKYVGEGNTVTIVWDRSEARLNLFAATDFTLREVIGLNGRIQVDAPNAIGIPVKSMATTYNLAGDRIFLDPERFSIAGMDAMFKSQPNFGAAQPAKFAILDDALLIYSACQLFYAVYELLHPSADLVMPDQISLTAVLHGDEIDVNFEKGPGLCLKWIFTISPTLKRVTVTDRKVHIEFAGSRFVRSRDFDVR